MKTAAVAIDDYKEEPFMVALTAAGFSSTVKHGITTDTRFIEVKYHESRFNELKTLLRELEAKHSRRAK